MRRIVLDGAVLQEATLHELLRRELSFPQWYGRNLDALYDCLTDVGEEVELCLCHWDSEENEQFGRQLRCVLYDAAEENDRLSITER